MIFIFFIFCNIFSVNKILQRKEIRDLSPAEWKYFKDCVLKLKSHAFFEDLSEIHSKVDKYAHNHPRFLPWHRMFLIYFEELLQVVNNDPTITVPYWNWCLDSEDPGSSIIFLEKYWGFTDCFEMNFPEKHCLKRNENEIDPFYNTAQLNKLINKKMRYDEFREAFELVPHAIVHFNTGGKDGDMSMMYSTNDPIFWHHHSFVDLMWHKKQLKNLKNNYDGEGADLNEVLLPFNKKIKDVMDLKNCNREYIEYKPVRVQNINLKAGRISEDYAKRHNYDIIKIRKVEDFLMNEKKKRGFFKKLICFLFFIRE
ncbi:hypothetical protein GVAV_003450 [Gurleya vavrai]